MKKTLNFILLILLVVGLSNCAPSDAVVQTAIAKTLEANPTATNQPINTPEPTATITPTSTNTPSATPAATDTPAPLLPEITDEIGAEMVLVPEGEFTMGSDEEVSGNRLSARAKGYYNVIDVQADHIPAHTVYLDSYYIDKYEVTNKLYQDCVNVGVCEPPVQSSSHTHESYYGNPEFDEYPVIFVNQFMASTFCEWRGARLPTEAEWEKAARGTDERLFAWGNANTNCTLANIARITPCVGDTTRVGSYLDGVSPYGLFDMTGNVWEWVSDWYDETYYENSPTNNPQGPEKGSTTIWRTANGIAVRGASFAAHDPVEFSNRVYLRSSILKPDQTDIDVGFRCASDAIP